MAIKSKHKKRTESTVFISVVAVLILAVLCTAASQTQQSESKSAQATASGNAENGKQVYESSRCWQCHGRSGRGGGEVSSLVPDPLPLPEFIRYVRAPTGEMPPYKADVLKDSDIADIYAFLTSNSQ